MLNIFRLLTLELNDSSYDDAITRNYPNRHLKTNFTCETGQMLINWFLSSFPSSKTSPIGQKGKNHDLQPLALHFCDQLLKFGIIEQIIDKDATQEETFKVRLATSIKNKN